jgi:hypothetical protein
MRQAIILGVSALLAAPVAQAAADVYRWVDEDGVVHYSDQPHPGAERLRIESAPAPGTRLPANATGARRAGAEQAAGQDPDPSFSYQSLTVSQPVAEETLWNIGGTLNVTLDLQPTLRPGHRVQLYFDGEAMEVSGTQFTLDEVYRGVHNIQAEVVDANGNVMIRSQPNRFYVQQTSVANPGG